MDKYFTNISGSKSNISYEKSKRIRKKIKGE